MQPKQGPELLNENRLQGGKTRPPSKTPEECYFAANEQEEENAAGKIKKGKGA